MDFNPGEGVNNPPPGEAYAIPMLKAEVLTAGLDPDQSRDVEIIMAAFDRGQKFMEALVSGDPDARRLQEALWLVLTSLTDGAIFPIMEAVRNGHDPICAFKGVMAGVAGLAFMGGVEYANHQSGVNPITARDTQPSREKVNLTDDDHDKINDLFARLQADMGDASDKED